MIFNLFKIRDRLMNVEISKVLVKGKVSVLPVKVQKRVLVEEVKGVCSVSSPVVQQINSRWFLFGVLLQFS